MGICEFTVPVSPDTIRSFLDREIRVVEHKAKVGLLKSVPEIVVEHILRERAGLAEANGCAGADNGPLYTQLSVAWWRRCKVIHVSAKARRISTGYTEQVRIITTPSWEPLSMACPKRAEETLKALNKRHERVLQGLHLPIPSYKGTLRLLLQEERLVILERRILPILDAQLAIVLCIQERDLKRSIYDRLGAVWFQFPVKTTMYGSWWLLIQEIPPILVCFGFNDTPTEFILRNALPDGVGLPGNIADRILSGEISLSELQAELALLSLRQNLSLTNG